MQRDRIMLRIKWEIIPAPASKSASWVAMFGRYKWSIPQFVCRLCSLCLSRNIALSIRKIPYNIIKAALTTLLLKIEYRID